MKRILYILPYLGIGGTEKHVLDLIRGFSEQYELFLLAPSGETLSQFQAERIAYYSFARLDQQPVKGLHAFFKQLRLILQNHAIDLIHIHGAPELLFLTRRVAKKVPIIFTVHGFHGPRKDWDYWGCTKMCNRYANRVIAVASAEEQILLRKGIRSNLIRTIHNGVPDPLQLDFHTPTHCAHIPEHCTVVGAIARLETTKGLNFLLEAFSKIIKKFPHLHLIIVGSGSKEEELLNLTNKLQLTESVTFAGYQSNVHDYLHSYKIFVIPSLHEAHPLVLMEGMGHAKPVIATTVGGIPEVIQDGVNGLLVPPADSQALVEAIEKLLKNPMLLDELGQGARKTYEKSFTVEQMLHETAKEYTSLLDN